MSVKLYHLNRLLDQITHARVSLATILWCLTALRTQMRLIVLCSEGGPGWGRVDQRLGCLGVME